VLLTLLVNMGEGGEGTRRSRASGCLNAYGW
jgi:hypothetical protein